LRFRLFTAREQAQSTFWILNDYYRSGKETNANKEAAKGNGGL